MNDGSYSQQPEDGSAPTDPRTLARIWRKFNVRFASEADCLEELYRRAVQEGVVKCRHCGSAELVKNYGDRVGRCRDCTKTSWLTAGTFFHRMKLARPWLAAIWLMEHGVSLSSSKFHKLVGIAYSTALTIFKKVTAVIHSQMRDDAVVVPSLLFTSLMCRRSRETPARAHPLAEQEEIERTVSENAPGVQSPEGGGSTEDLSEPGNVDSNRGGGSPCGVAGTMNEQFGVESHGTDNWRELSAADGAVYELLSAEPVHFDTLCELSGLSAGQLAASLTMLELAGLTEHTVGNWYTSCAGPKRNLRDVSPGQTSGESGYESGTTISVDDFLAYVIRTFQGISRKYLQNYLGAYWCRHDRRRWRSGALLKACLQARRMSCAEILAYVSPISVKMVLR